MRIRDAEELLFRVSTYRQTFEDSLKDDERLPLSIYNGILRFLKEVEEDLKDLRASERDVNDQVRKLEESLDWYEKTK